MLQSNKPGVVKSLEECDLAFEALTCKKTRPLVKSVLQKHTFLIS